MYTITPFEFRMKEVLEDFEEAMDFRDLGYSTGELHRYGFDSETAILKALARAMRVCRSLEIDSRKHFRYFFRVDLKSKQATREWKVSKLGFYLLICNGEPTNPYTGAFQMRMLRELLPRIE